MKNAIYLAFGVMILSCGIWLYSGLYDASPEKVIEDRNKDIEKKQIPSEYAEKSVLNSKNIESGHYNVAIDIAPIEDEVNWITFQIQTKNNLMELVQKGELNKEDIFELFSLSENGDVTASAILLESYIGCEPYISIDTIDGKPLICYEIDQAGKKEKEDYSHPFFKIEQAAMQGDRHAQYEYWRALKHALAEKIINPLIESDRWNERRNMGLSWQDTFSKNGIASASATLALDYYTGLVIEKDYSNTIYYAERALELNPSLNSMRKLVNAAIKKMGGDNKLDD